VYIGGSLLDLCDKLYFFVKEDIFIYSKENFSISSLRPPKPSDSASGSFKKETGLPKPKNFLFIFKRKKSRAYKIRKVEKFFPVLELKFFPKEFQAESLGGGES